MTASITSSASAASTIRGRLPLAGSFAVWALWGVWSAQQSALAAMVSGQPAATRASLPLSLTSAAFWALLTPLLMLTTRVIRDRFAQRPARLAAHVGLFLLVHVADVTTYWIASDVIASTPRPFLPLLFSLVTFNGLAYTVIAVIITAIDSHETLRAQARRESQLQGQLASAQFHALRAQLHPHFLFNALNAISSLIHSDQQRADRMLSQLSELLRLAIDTATQPEVTLKSDVAFTRRYLDIERMRYGDRLDVHFNINGETFDALVPTMLLQPLVENAVRHGIAPHARPGRVEIHARRAGDELLVVIRDTGTGFDPDTNESAGVGLSTTRARLETLYGGAQRISFEHSDDGFEVRVRLPFRWDETSTAA
jgi:sensor histidine kinase YesM